MTANVVEDIVDRLPADRLAAELGVDRQSALDASRAVIVSLVGGMQHNAGGPGEQSLSGALQQHAASGLLAGGRVDLGAVDVADGEKIVGHVFGDQSAQLAQAIGSRTPGGSELVERLLPILAPIVLAYLAEQVTQGPPATGGLLGDILGGLLRGGPRATRPAGTPGQAHAPSGDGTADPGELTIGAAAPPTDDGSPLPATGLSGDGGILGEILAGILGKRN